MPELQEGGFAVITKAVAGCDPIIWREGKAVKVVEVLPYEVSDTSPDVRVADGCGRTIRLCSSRLEPIELPTVHESMSRAHDYLTRTRSKGGWRTQVIWGDLPDEVMAQEVAGMLKGYADMVSELERLRAENHNLRSRWDLAPEAQDDLARRLG